MKIIRDLLDSVEHHFEKGGKFEKLYPAYEMVDTFLYTPKDVTKGRTHVRDNLDLKRLMITVAIALGPVGLMALYNTGFQANNALSQLAEGSKAFDTWRIMLLHMIGIGINPDNFFSNLIHGALYFVPIFLVANIVGGLWEALFSIVRRHEINEGFLVTGILFPLTLPPTIPLWQVAVGISFGVVVGKEIFGGTGKNFLNPALTGRAFLFFAYPAQISGDAVWTAVDGFTGATALGEAAIGGVDAISFTWMEAFIGMVPGSMGETSALACLLGAGLLIATGIGSWRVMAGVFLSTVFFGYLLNFIGSDTNPMFGMSPWWHMVLGGWAFGTVFMATDPVSATMTLRGKWYYGALIGLMVVLVRVINPAYPEGMMLAILFANVFSPLIDWAVVQKYVKKRGMRYARG